MQCVWIPCLSKISKRVSVDGTSTTEYGGHRSVSKREGKDWGSAESWGSGLSVELTLEGRVHSWTECAGVLNKMRTVTL